MTIKQLQAVADGCDCRLPLHGYCGVVHHRGLRGDAVCARHGRDPGAVGCGGRDEAAGGTFAFILFAAGLFNASLFAASILPLSTAYTVCEGMGFESGLDKSFSEAPFFYWFYTVLIAPGAGVVLWPNFPLVKVTILVAGAERRAAAGDHDLHAEADQQAGADGQAHQ